MPIRDRARGGRSWDGQAVNAERLAVRPWIRHALVYRVGAGVLSDLAGGAVFGAIMHLSGALVTVAKLVDGQSVLVGWAVHLAISAFVGLTFGIVLGAFARGPIMCVLLGVLYGWLWWIIGGLTLMPLRLGMGLFVFNADAFMSLAGHVAYGLALGAVYAFLTPAQSIDTS
jgi:hypothetical protein